eukprot:1155803-Pelagomonas_calceolata.AAC.6
MLVSNTFADPNAVTDGACPVRCVVHERQGKSPLVSMQWWATQAFGGREAAQSCAQLGAPGHMQHTEVSLPRCKLCKSAFPIEELPCSTTMHAQFPAQAGDIVSEDAEDHDGGEAAWEEGLDDGNDQANDPSPQSAEEEEEDEDAPQILDCVLWCGGGRGGWGCSTGGADCFEDSYCLGLRERLLNAKKHCLARAEKMHLERSLWRERRLQLHVHAQVDTRPGPKFLNSMTLASFKSCLQSKEQQAALESWRDSTFDLGKGVTEVPVRGCFK